MADHTTTTDGLHLPADQREDVPERDLPTQADHVGGGNVMMWLLGALGFVRKAAQAAFDFIREKPALAAIIALSVALAGVWWVLSGKLETAIDQRDSARALAKEERANHVQTIANYREAQTRARAFAVAQKRAEEARHKANAERIDREHETHVASAGSDIDRHLVRVRAEQRDTAAQGGGGSTVAAPDNRGPGVPAGLPADHVPVTESDLRACAAATAYALDAREWALGLAR